MDLVSIDPIFNLYNAEWPIWTYPVQQPAAKFTLRGLALDSLVSPGCIISGGSIESSVLSPNVRVDEGSKVDHSVLLTGVRVGHTTLHEGTRFHTASGTRPSSATPSWTRT